MFCAVGEVAPGCSVVVVLFVGPFDVVVTPGSEGVWTLSAKLEYFRHN